MKKALALCLAFAMLLPLVACGGIGYGEGKKVREMSEEIIRCFTERDKQALKNLFCKQIRSRPGFNNEIDAAFTFLECEVYISSEIKTSASGGMLNRYGKIMSWDVRPEIPYLKVLVGSQAYYYSIEYYWKIVDIEEETREGLQYMEIELLNVEDIHIGERID